MVRAFSDWFAVALLAFAASCAGAAESPPSSVASTDSSNDLQALASEYLHLRQLRAQLAPGEFRAELSGHGGRLHEVMHRLGMLLSAKRTTEATVIDLLGAPDRIYGPGRRHGTGIVVARGTRHLVYWWRGGHDYLYFVVRQSEVTDARWWFAYE